MWDGFLGRRNFYTKCKSALKMINLRMEIIMNKRHAMQKFLKSDVADLLRSNLDYNAYGRVEGLYVELNLSSCYDYVKERCAIVADKLKVMDKERECPEECRVAAASLVYAAARFADLPELRDLRNMFTDKFGNALDPSLSKEFVEKLRSNPPTREMKFQLMKDIAKEFSIAWDPASLEQKLCNSAPQPYQSTRGNKFYQTMSDDNLLAKKETRDRKEVVYEHTTSTASTYKEADAKKLVPAPYVKPEVDYKKDGSDQDQARAWRRSVRSRFIRRQENVEDREENKEKSLEGEDDSDQGSKIDRLLRHYSMKPWRKTCADLTSESASSPSPSRKKELEGDDYGRYGRSASMHVSHMHPKLPDYDELASRIEALRKM